MRVNEPAIAGGSIKPRVERSGPLGTGTRKVSQPTKWATDFANPRDRWFRVMAHVSLPLSPASRAHAFLLT